MEQLLIRRAIATDREVIAANNSAMALETEAKHLDRDELTAGVKELLANGNHGFYLLAEIAGTIVGQLMVTFEWSDWRNGDFWWIQSVYVAPGHRGQGVYSALYKHLHDEAKKAERVCGLKLYTDRDNTVAQAVYKSLGMNSSRYIMYEVDWSSS